VRPERLAHLGVTGHHGGPAHLAGDPGCGLAANGLRGGARGGRQSLAAGRCRGSPQLVRQRPRSGQQHHRSQRPGQPVAPAGRRRSRPELPMPWPHTFRFRPPGAFWCRPGGSWWRRAGEGLDGGGHDDRGDRLGIGLGVDREPHRGPFVPGRLLVPDGGPLLRVAGCGPLLCGRRPLPGSRLLLGLLLRGSYRFPLPGSGGDPLLFPSSLDRRAGRPLHGQRQPGWRHPRWRPRAAPPRCAPGKRRGPAVFIHPGKLSDRALTPLSRRRGSANTCVKQCSKHSAALTVQL
jgi:hypothetical protein